MRNLRIIPKPNNPTVLKKILLTQNLHLVLFFNEPGWGIIIKQKFNVDKIQSTSKLFNRREQILKSLLIIILLK